MVSLRLAGAIVWDSVSTTEKKSKPGTWQVLIIPVLGLGAGHRLLFHWLDSPSHQWPPQSAEGRGEGSASRVAGHASWRTLGLITNTNTKMEGENREWSSTGLLHVCPHIHYAIDIHRHTSHTHITHIPLHIIYTLYTHSTDRYIIHIQSQTYRHTSYTHIPLHITHTHQTRTSHTHIIYISQTHRHTIKITHYRHTQSHYISETHHTHTAQIHISYTHIQLHIRQPSYTHHRHIAIHKHCLEYHTHITHTTHTPRQKQKD